MKVPCSPGLWSAPGSDQCLLQCERGKLCANGAKKECPRGFFCPVVSALRLHSLGQRLHPPPFLLQGTGHENRPCPAGRLGLGEGLQSDTGCTACPKGKYCPIYGAQAPKGDCHDGYFCEKGASTPRPEVASSASDTTRAFGPCPVGFHCKAGAKAACDKGSFQPTTHARAATACQACPYGFVCPTAALPRPSQRCKDGVECPEGSQTEAKPCPAGSFCTGGIAWPCPAGSFASDAAARSQCTRCPAKRYCPPGAAKDGPCTPGHYCEAGTKAPHQFPCPAGHFSKSDGVASAGECTPCPNGQFCLGRGNRDPTGSCEPGWACSEAASSPRPHHASCLCQASPATRGGTICPEGFVCPAKKAPSRCPPGAFCRGLGLQVPTGMCPAGFLCPEGAKNPVEPFARCPSGGFCLVGASNLTNCPAGTFRQQGGAQSAKDCDPCPPGSLCPTSEKAQPCPSGSFCPGQNAPAKGCPKGHFCPTGSARARPCPAGRFQEGEGQSACKECAAGLTCVWTKAPAAPKCSANLNAGISKAESCPPGFDCPAGNMARPCGRGSFVPKPGGGCQPCPVSKFCFGEPSGNVSGVCADGFQCPASSANPARPEQRCPQGQFCSRGVLTACPAGFYGPKPGLQTAAQCTKCPPGYLCTGDVTKPCPAGSWCRGNKGTPCAEGFVCEANSADPRRCDPGFQPSASRDTCVPCSKGSFCPGSAGPQECPPGHFCIEGSHQPMPCPPGTFSAAKNAQAESTCKPSPEHRFISQYGSDKNGALCDTGYSCKSGAQSAKPSDKVVSTEGRVPSILCVSYAVLSLRTRCVQLASCATQPKVL